MTQLSPFPDDVIIEILFILIILVKRRENKNTSN